MKTVHFLADKSRIVDYLLSPVRFNKNQLSERGYKVKIFYKPSKRCYSCDYLLLISKPVLNIVGEKKTVISGPSPTLELISTAKKFAGKVIWLDSSDSTSVTHFELLPYIDLYLKKQLFKDKSMYKKEFFGGRIFTDFYHHKFGVGDDSDYEQYYPLNKEYVDKVELAWNIGMGVMNKAFTKWNKLRIKTPLIINPSYTIDYADIGGDRRIDLFIRTTSDLKSNLMSFHRRELVKRLQIIIEKNQLNGSTTGEWLSDKEFFTHLDQTKILPSPFGWGELGVRDYEAFIHGSVLLKPDMYYMSTWPDLFKKDVTYSPFRWDYEDLEEKIMDLLGHKEKRLSIARAGQLAYKESISKEGMAQFCDWFIQQINK